MRQDTARQPRWSGNRVRAAAGMLLGGVCVVGVCLAARYWMLDESASAGTPKRSPAPSRTVRTPAGTAARPALRSAQPGPQAPAAPLSGRATSPLPIVASVNGRDITRDELGRECLRHYGEEVLESLVDKYLVVHECQRRGISVTQAEVSAEIEQWATKYKVPVGHWLKMLEEERGINPKQYAEDYIWPILALRKLAGDRLNVTQRELAEQFERQYGEAVKARMIVCGDLQSAEQIRAAAAAQPDQFGALAKDNSVDAPSASLNGLIHPIRKHTGPKEIEQVAFQMEDGEISEVIPVGEQYVILKREGLQPAARVAFEQVKIGLIELVKDRKTHRVADEIFRELQDQAEVINVFNDPDQTERFPGVAAVINGHKITNRELAEECIERYGEDVLRGTINRRLLEQACEKRNLTITKEDLDREIARAASRWLPLKPDGSPDVETWIDSYTKRHNIAEDIYRSDEVWPSVALKKLVGEQVQVTDEDLQKGYEANFGPKVDCLAIILDDQRRAQKVWEMARSRPTKEQFGDLAEKYSVDPSGRALRGEVSPIQKHGGQPRLEEKAFALKPGEISAIIQVGQSKYVILFCEGQIEPIPVDFQTVRDEIHADIYEKKLRVAMARYFRQLQEDATIDNHLAGTVQSPNRTSGRQTTARRSSRAQTPVR